MPKRSGYIVAALLIFSSLAFAKPVSTPWLWSLKDKEPELFDIVMGGLRTNPQLKEFAGRPTSEYVAARTENRAKFRAKLDSKTEELIVNKLIYAYSSQPPDWNVVGLALQASTYSRPNSRVLSVSEEIVSATLASDNEDWIKVEAMNVLALSGEQKYSDVIFNYLAKGLFRQAKNDIASSRLVYGAIQSLALLSGDKEEKYLAQLAVLYPCDSTRVDSPSSDHPGRSDFDLPNLVKERLDLLDDSKGESKVQYNEKEPL